MIRFLLASTALAIAGPALAHTGQTTPGQTTPGQTPPAQTAPAPAGAPDPGGTAGQTAPVAGQAGAPATVAVGAAVNDQQGQPVGTISQINGDTVVLDTGSVKAGVPRAAVGPGPNGGLITTVTKAQIEAAANQGQAQLKSLLVAGTPVHASDGTTVVGTVKAADDQFVTVATSTAGKAGEVRLPATAFTASNGSLVTSASADQIAAAASQATAAPAASDSGTTAETKTKTTTRSRRR